MAAAIAAAIRDGGFPHDDTVLSSDLTAANISPLLVEISRAKDDLKSAVEGISKDEASDVDGWIAQAKKVQADIARCKQDAREIIDEHERVEALREVRDDARIKADLLQDEISFNETLQHQIRLISQCFTSLNTIDAEIRQQRFYTAAQSLPGLESSISSVSGEQARSLLSSMHTDLSRSTNSALKEQLTHMCQVKTTQEHVHWEFLQHAAQEDSSPSTDQVIDALEALSALEDAQSIITKSLTGSLMPHFHPRSRLKVSAAAQQGQKLTLALSSTTPGPSVLVEVTSTILGFLYEHAPSKFRQQLLEKVTAELVPQLLDKWLDKSIPGDLDSVDVLDTNRLDVLRLANQLESYRLSEAQKVNAWVQDLPKVWLDKRCMASLNVVRKAFNSATGITRHVERHETQTITIDPDTPPETTDDEWNEAWDDDGDETKTQPSTQDAADDDSDAWGFDTEENESKQSNPPSADQQATEDDEGDAWGWGDDEGTEDKAANPPQKQQTQPRKVNGAAAPTSKQEDVVLTELYTITDLPDHILEQIGKDTLDHQALLSSPPTFFTSSASSTAVSTGLQSLPTLVLSIYRAIAPTNYFEGTNSFPVLSPMNLYNDTLYLAQKLSENPDLGTTFQSDIGALTRFARQIYTSELTTQRQIVADLLDNAQGFVGCTRQPNTTVCENAVTSTTDYIRSLHKQWSAVLSGSHLAQSVGSLVSSVMGKMIKDIEDMEDISEAESQKLLSYMEQVSKLEDLFVAATPGGAEGLIGTDNADVADLGPVSTIAVHVPSYLRFQYLQQILDSSLVDIRYLWTDAGLSLEFSADEVVDLIRALFAESSHRRSAIQAIRS